MINELKTEQLALLPTNNFKIFHYIFVNQIVFFRLFFIPFCFVFIIIIFVINLLFSLSFPLFLYHFI